jgi:hypothetical protein
VPPFATPDDVATRLGRDLSGAEQNMVEQVVEQVTGLIAEVVGKDLAWAAALDPVPATLKVLCIQKAIQVGTNPQQLRQEGEQLGSYQHNRTWPAAQDMGLYLTEAEEQIVRRAVYGTTRATVPVASIADQFVWPDFPTWVVNIPEPETLDAMENQPDLP